MGARAPIGFFAYPGKPAILTRDGAEIVTLADGGADLGAALSGLCAALAASDTPPAHMAQHDLPDAPSGTIDLEKLAACIARAIPQDGIALVLAGLAQPIFLTLCLPRGQQAGTYAGQLALAGSLSRSASSRRTRPRPVGS